MKHTYLPLIPLFLLVSWYTDSYAQRWSALHTGGHPEKVSYGRAVTTDAMGNTYVMGTYRDQISLTRHLQGQQTYILTSATHRDDRMFLLKYDARGNLLWTNSAIGQYVEGQDLAVDAAGNVYVAGSFADKTRFSSIDGNNERLWGNQPGMLFLVKYDARGKLLWAVKGGNARGTNRVGTLVAAGNSIHLVGHVEVNDEPLVYHQPNYTQRSFQPALQRDANRVVVGQLLSYAPNGHLRSAQFLGGERAQFHLHDLEIDARGNRYLSGIFRGFFELNGQSFASESWRGIVISLNAGGTLRWHWQFETDFLRESHPRLAWRGDELAVTLGQRGNLITHDAKGRERSWPTADAPAMFLGWFNARGDLRRHTSIPAPTTLLGVEAIAFGPNGNLYTATRQEGTSEKDENFALHAWNDRGERLWKIESGGRGIERIYGLHANQRGELWTTGYFHGGKAMAFPPIAAREFGDYNFFLAKMSPRLAPIDPVATVPAPISMGAAAVVPLATPQDMATAPPDAEFFRGRRLVTRRRVVVSQPELELFVWDNHQVDGDIISIYLGDRSILHATTLNATPRRVVIQLNDDTSRLVLHALNVGRIGPNTTAVTVSDGKTRQQVHMQAGLAHSEALEIVYRRPGSQPAAMQRPSGPAGRAYRPETAPPGARVAGYTRYRPSGERERNPQSQTDEEKTEWRWFPFKKVKRKRKRRNN